MPKGFHVSLQNHKDLIADYIAKDCGGSKQQFLKKTPDELKHAGLSGLLFYYGGSKVNMVLSVMGQDYAQPWELGTTPGNYWQGEQGKDNARKAVRWLVNGEFDGDLNQVYGLTITDFGRVGLGGMLLTVYENRPIKALVDTYGPSLERWKFKKHPKDYWLTEEGWEVVQEGVRALCVEKFGEFSVYEEIADSIPTLRLKDFEAFGLEKVLKHFENSHQRLLEKVTGLPIKDYEWVTASQGAWSNSHLNCILALKEYLESEHITSDDELLALKKHRLPGKLKTMLNTAFDSSLTLAIMAVFPLRFQPWQFPIVPQGYWKSEEGKKAAIELTRNMIQNKLGFWTFEKIRTVTVLDFKRHGLSFVISGAYGSSSIDAIMSAYPGTFQREDFYINAKEERKFSEKVQKLFPRLHFEIRARPSFLRTGRRNQLELDLYCASKRLAFEYQGLQHTVDKREHFGRSYDFESMRLRDKRKRQLCKEQRVTLIEVAYGANITAEFVQSLLEKAGRTDLIKLMASTAR